MKSAQFKSYVLVSIQVISLILIFISGRPIPNDLPLIIIEITGIALGMWAFITMGWRNLTITPLVKQEANLVTQGPYGMIRHPMYSAVLLVIWPLIIDQYSLFRFIVGMILTVDLVIKMFYEESLLRKHFAGYDLYMRDTYRLIPFIL